LVRPDELRLHVLHYTVHFGKGFQKNHFDNQPYYILRAETQFLHDVVYPLMSIPEVKALAIEALYSSNTIQIQYGGDLGAPPTTVTHFPPRDFRAHVRHLRVLVARTSALDFESLARIAEGGLGFGKLQSVNITITNEQDASPPKDDIQVHLMNANIIQLDTRHLSITYWYMDGGDFYLDPFEMPVLGKFTLKHGSVQPKEEYMRYYRNTDRYNRYMVHVWPAHRDHHACIKTTRKTMSVEAQQAALAGVSTLGSRLLTCRTHRGMRRRRGTR
jgi:hypothetical protein